MRFIGLSLLCVSVLATIPLFASECGRCRNETVSCSSCGSTCSDVTYTCASPRSLCYAEGSYPLDQPYGEIGTADIIGYDVVNSAIMYRRIDISTVPGGNVGPQYSSVEPVPYTASVVEAVYVPGTGSQEAFASNSYNRTPENRSIYEYGADKGIPASDTSGSNRAPEER